MNYNSCKLSGSKSGLGFFNNYIFRILLVAWMGIQIPVVALIYFFGLSTSLSNQAIASSLPTAFLLDFVSTSITLYLLYRLLLPVALASQTLSQYLQNENLPGLDSRLPAEVGTPFTGTEKVLERLDEIIQHLTSYDNLTGLPQRELFQTYIQQAISQIESDQQFALIVLDLDSLKDINSILGRQVGDLLLTKVAERISALIEPEDTLARFGGDEFVILRTQVTSHDNLITLSNSLLASLSKSFTLYGEKIHCTAKIGITTYPFDGTSVEQLLQNADTAIYQAGQQRSNTYQFYSPAISKQLKRALAIKENLRYALAREELSIYYQPRIEIMTGRLVGIEALLRWHNPELGMVSPLEFIPIAEETNLIMPIGEWVLHNACLQNQRWQKEGLKPLRVSVNISACQFKQADLMTTVDSILRNTHLEMAYLELEITESLLLEDIDRAIAMLWELKHRGISIALDDFGTGYSSLSYLQKLPIDNLKIDRSFVTNIASNPDSAAISKAIVALAKSMELNITAEGVETRSQFEYLKNLGCHEVQGYYFSKPLSSEQLRAFLISEGNSSNSFFAS